MRKISIMIFAVFVTVEVFALGEDWAGNDMVAVSDVELYNSLPTGLFCNRGTPLATISSGERVRVLSHQVVNCAVFIHHDIIEVERLTPGIPIGNQRGFMFAGDEDGRPNLRSE